MAVTWRTLALVDGLRRQLEHVTDAHTRDLVRAWVDAWNEVEPDLRAALLEQLVAGEHISRARLLRSLRLRSALDVIADQLRRLADEAGVRITGDLQAVVDTAGAAQASVIDSQLPPGFLSPSDLEVWSRVDAWKIAAIVERSTQQITSRTRPLAADAYAAVRRELIRGVAAGSNPRATADRIIQRTQGRFNGGLTRALVISRTETLDAHRAAAQLAQAEQADVLSGWSWLAKLDERTCRSCWAQHGRLHGLDEAGPLDHQQGRCARLPATKSWAELGFADVVEPPSVLPDAAATFGGLSEVQQRAILGPAGHAAWAAGEFPMDAWTVRRTTSGWRDSFAVAPVSKPRRRGRRAA
ncbi:MAG: phage head morphogenesis protein [Streptomycetaceae bacterium]|nr:phage head morphogenesis protein [Streptomycetaceae bacterium]